MVSVEEYSHHTCQTLPTQVQWLNNFRVGPYYSSLQTYNTDETQKSELEIKVMGGCCTFLLLFSPLTSLPSHAFQLFKQVSILYSLCILHKRWLCTVYKTFRHINPCISTLRSCHPSPVRCCFQLTYILQQYNTIPEIQLWLLILESHPRISVAPSGHSYKTFMGVPLLLPVNACTAVKKTIWQQ